MTGTAIRVPVDVRWADTDQYGHVNNVAALRLVEEARIRALGLPDQPVSRGAGPEPLLAVLAPGTFTMVAGQRVEYVAELAYDGRPVVAEVWLSRIGARSVTMDCRLLAGEGETEVLRARVAVVVMDVGTRRARPLTETEITRLTPARGEPLAFRD